MRNSISARMFFLLSLVLVGALGAGYWKARSLFDFHQKKMTEESLSKISAEVGRLTSDRVKYLNQELLGFVSTREQNAKNKEIPKGWWGTFLLVATMEQTPQGWAPRWMEWGMQSPVQQWPTGAVSQMLEEIQWDTIRESQKYFQRLSDPQKQPLFAFISKVPNVDPTNAVKRVAVGILSPVALTDLVSNHKGGAYTVAVVDRHGFVFSHPSSALIGSSLERNPVVQDLMSNGELSRTEYPSAKVLAGAQSISGTNLYAASFIPTSMALRGGRSLLTSFLVIGVGLLLLAAALSLYFSRWFSSPLRRIGEFVRTIGQGAEPDLAGPTFQEVEDLFEQVTHMRIQILNQIEDANRLRKVAGEGERQALLRSLSASLGQEIKNPLIGILGHSQLAKDKAGGREELKKHFDAIEKEARKTKNIVDNLLKFSGSEKADVASINFYETVAGALSQVEPYLQAKGIKINKHLGAVPRIQGNYGQLRQAIVSILLHQGKVMERTLSKQLSIYLESHDELVLLRLEDTGEGLSEDYQQTVFEPNPSNLSDPTFELAAVHGVVQAHGGQISLASTVGKGNAFTLSFAAEDKTVVTGPEPVRKFPKLSELAPISPAVPAPALKPEIGLDFDSNKDLSADEILALADDLALRPKVAAQAAEPLLDISDASVKDLGFIEKETFESRKLMPSPSDFLPNEFSVDLPPPPTGLQPREEQFKVVVRKPRLKV